MKSSQTFIITCAIIASLNAACSAKIKATSDAPAPLPPQKTQSADGTWLAPCVKDQDQPLYLLQSILMEGEKFKQETKIFSDDKCTQEVSVAPFITEGTFKIIGPSATVAGAMDIDFDGVWPDGSHQQILQIFMVDGNSLYLGGDVYDGTTGRPIELDRSLPYVKR